MFELRESGEKETKIETAIKKLQRKIAAILAILSMTAFDYYFIVKYQYFIEQR